jgi:hypothetical protein
VDQLEKCLKRGRDDQENLDEVQLEDFLASGLESSEDKPADPDDDIQIRSLDSAASRPKDSYVSMIESMAGSDSFSKMPVTGDDAIVGNDSSRLLGNTISADSNHMAGSNVSFDTNKELARDWVAGSNIASSEIICHDEYNGVVQHNAGSRERQEERNAGSNRSSENEDASSVKRQCERMSTGNKCLGNNVDAGSIESQCGREIAGSKGTGSANGQDEGHSIAGSDIVSSDASGDVNVSEFSVKNVSTGKVILTLDFSNLDDFARRKMDAIVKMLNRAEELDDEKFAKLVNIVLRYDKIWKLDLDDFHR